ncbi:hypothetical protein [Schaalia vaccimaxillae]|nr:hypothetical protein [Schaalia vaccimaxillae]
MTATSTSLIARLRAWAKPKIQWRNQKRDEVQFVLDRPLMGNLVAR